MPFTHAEFERLFNRYHLDLFNYFLRQENDLDLAGDLVAWTFLQAWEHADEYRGDNEDQVRGWLRAIAGSVLVEHRRRVGVDERARRKLPGHVPSLSDAEIERLEELYSTEAFRWRVAARHAELPFEQRVAVRLRIIEELPYKEVARQMNCTPQTARARVSRGLRTLKAWLDNDYAEWLREQ